MALIASTACHTAKYMWHPTAVNYKLEGHRLQCGPLKCLSQ